MPLFNMPSPEQVRTSARQGLFQRAQQAAATPRGRGFVQLASQAGGLFGEAIGEATGGKLPGQEKAEKFQAVQAQITQEFQGQKLEDPQIQMQMMGKTAQLLGQAGFTNESAQAMQFANEIRASIKAPKTVDKFEEIFGADGKPIAQKNLSTNKIVAHPNAAKDPDTVINNNLGDQDEFAKSLSRQIGADIAEQRIIATTASKALNQSNDAIDLLNSGVITGTGAEFIKNTGKLINRIGFSAFEDDVKNTEAFMANMGNATLAILGSGALGAGTGISDNDRKFAKQIAGGEISLSEKAIRRILSLNQKVNLNTINRFNDDLSKIPRGSMPFDLRIDAPKFKSPLKKLPTPLTEDDYNNLKSGAEYIDPDDGKKYRKP
jgi:hypothetical protein